MLKALAWKETRELLPLLLLGSLLQIYLVLSITGFAWAPIVRSQGSIPFVSDLSQLVVLLGGILAIGFGLWQTMWESARGTFLFLLHRPLPRTWIFGGKLGIGLAVSIGIVFIPLLLYTAWAATPGTHASPFLPEASTTLWRQACDVPLVYLGAFLSGLRPARWYGTRFLPLIASLVACVMIEILAGWWLAQLMFIVILIAVFIGVILQMSQKVDFS